MSKLQGEILTLKKMSGSVSTPKSLSGNVGAKTINIGAKGDDGATFVPSVSDDGVISWTNDKELPNPEPVNIKGVKGDKGDAGYTPVKGVDYRDGIDGKDGKDGKDGYTPVKGVDYRDGIDGRDGVDGKDGADGKAGADGYTPVRGTDYWTNGDKEEIVSDTVTTIDTPISSKTYEDIRYSETVIYNGTYPYVKFGEIKPSDYDKPCSITLRLRVDVNNTDGSMPIAVSGDYVVKLHFTQDVVSSTNLIPRYKYLAFEVFSKFPGTSYRPMYTLCTRGLNNAGFNAQNTIPFGWVRGSSDYKCNTCTRNITVDLIECDNCTARLEDEIVHYKTAEFLGDGAAANYDGITSFSDIGTVGDRHTGDYNVDTYTRLNDNGSKQVADCAAYRYCLLLEKMDGTFAPLHTNNKSGTTINGGVAVPNTTSAFKIGGRILYCATTTTTAVGAFSTHGDIEYTCDGRYLSTNKAGNAIKIDGEPLTAANAKALYLKVKDNGDLTFSLDSSLPADIGFHLTQTLRQ